TSACARMSPFGSTPNVRFLDAPAHATGLEAESADIVTASQALHWMEPDTTFAEVARLLRPGGVFAACDADWPPLVNWDAEEAYRCFMQRIHALERALEAQGRLRAPRRWSKDGHLERMRRSGRFRQICAFCLHQVEEGDAARMVGLALSFGGVQNLRKAGVGDADLGLDELREALVRAFGGRTLRWFYTYYVRVGRK
ncbi:MAG: class I SAM-dependent methyltransferase, partial [bacterium]|nr:class I SAM-dependent methyltransferase [bacterium]